ncbi:ATP-dependent Clp protease proteolytic subunit [candidate division KSB1 bacterium]|nr:ATP-dependent Clp protease proteolytic subunit [candidate division KSB1 bacterium]
MREAIESMFSDREINRLFLEKRKVFLWGQVDDKLAEDVVKKLIYLDSIGDRDIQILINSPGGSVTSGMAIYDAMHYVNSEVSTVCMGLAASMGALLLTAGTKNKRYALPHSRMLLHQPLIAGQIIAPATDIKIHSEEILKTRAALNGIFAKHTGQDIEKITQDTERDFFMNSEEAKDYGLIDAIIEHA